MWPNSQFPADLVTLTEEIVNGKLHFLCSEKPTMNPKSFTNWRNNMLILSLILIQDN